jgi:hypothetical protein
MSWATNSAESTTIDIFNEIKVWLSSDMLYLPQVSFNGLNFTVLPTPSQNPACKSAVWKQQTIVGFIIRIY